MTQDEIIRSPLGREQLVALAREAGISSVWAEASTRQLERFAALVAAHEREKCFDAAMKAAERAVDAAMLLEREECAKVCDVLVSYSERQRDDPTIGKYVEGFGDGSISCAAAIRNRSNK